MSAFPARFRIWDSRINGFHKPADEVIEESGRLPVVGNLHPYVLAPDGWLMATDGYHIGPCETPLDIQFVVERDTGMVDSKGKRIYENDIVSFTIKGITHGPEPDEVDSAQVWWCREDACWALGRWGKSGGWCGDWWYTFQDRIDRGSLKVLGNVHEHPERLVGQTIIT